MHRQSHFVPVAEISTESQNTVVESMTCALSHRTTYHHQFWWIKQRLQFMEVELRLSHMTTCTTYINQTTLHQWQDQDQNQDQQHDSKLWPSRTKKPTQRPNSSHNWISSGPILHICQVILAYIFILLLDVNVILNKWRQKLAIHYYLFI